MAANAMLLLTLIVAASPVLGIVVDLRSIPGADPTGQQDSSPAINAELRKQCAASYAESASYGTIPTGKYGALAVVPVDVTLDLSDGKYRMDSPLVINGTVACTGTIVIEDGTFLAGPSLGSLGNSSFIITVLQYWSGLGVRGERLHDYTSLPQRSLLTTLSGPCHKLIRLH